MDDEDNFYTISKTAKIIGVQTHVLRFWEKKFFILKPKKRSSGRRYYSSNDIKHLSMIKKLLYEDGFTIKGAINHIERSHKVKSTMSQDTIYESILHIKTLIREGTSLITKNLD